MKKFLPIFLVISFFATLVFLPLSVNAQAPAQPGGANQVNNPNVPAPGGRWVVDPEVTFIGKNTARSGLLLDWTLQNYNWVCVKKVANRVCDNSDNPIAKYWSLIVLYIVVPLLFFVILATSIVIIVTRGRSLTIMRFLPRFVAVVLLIVFSYSMVQFFYQFTDLIQGFFLRTDPAKPCPPDCISQKDLLYVGWGYKDFVGLRLLGDYNAESAFISLLLAKLTALTYFVMVFLLLVRKIILWFFVIVSPIFPILLLYYPVRNTGKIWIGEFFRWLMYAPLFAIFLKGLVFMWRSAIPLVFVPASGATTIGKADQIVFPTAVNILLGGPKQFVTQTNSVNLTETFALYVVSLLMLWTVILLPWVLLQIFLEYSAQFMGGDAGLMKTLVNYSSKPGNPIAPAGGKGVPPAEPGGAVLPFGKKFTMPKMPPHPGGAAKDLPIGTAMSTANATKTPMQGPYYASMPQSAQQVEQAKANNQMLNMANMQLPSIKDIAKFETSLMSRDKSKQQPVNDVVSNLAKIANPASITNATEREKYKEIRSKLVSEKNQGNLVAAGILNAAKSVSQASKQQTSASLKKASTNQVKDALVQVANPATVSSSKQREKLAAIHEKLSKAVKENKSQLASSILGVNQQTSSTDVEKIREKLMSAKKQSDVKERDVASTVAGAINTTISQAESTKNVKSAIQQMKDPASNMHQTLLQASKEGNQLASQILSFDEKATQMDVESLQDKIAEAKLKGDPIATKLAEETEKATSVPQVNRIQQVRTEDYQAVKDMWKENYQNMEIPDGMSGSRTDWIKDDVSNIDEIVGMLSSTDQEVVTQGLQEVSNILPFLMVGGFSQTEIIAYLKAKQEAAKEVAAEIIAEEETQVSVGVAKKATERTMAATMDEEEGGRKKTTASSEPKDPSASSGQEDADKKPGAKADESNLKDVLAEEEAEQKPVTEAPKAPEENKSGNNN